MVTFRESVKKLAEKSIKELDRFIQSDTTDVKRALVAVRLLSAGVKVDHMDQMKDKDNKSFGLRLMSFLPKDEATRKEYLRITNPELKPLLLDKPKSKK